MIQYTYNRIGRPINLPKNGTTELPAGSYIYENGEWKKLESKKLLVRDYDWDGLTQSSVPYEELRDVQ